MDAIVPRTRVPLIAAMILGAAALRLIPHPPNFTPIGAMALFAGAHFASPTLAFAVPISAMLLSDLALEFLYGYGIHALMPIVYATFAVVVGIGRLLRGSRRTSYVALAAVASAVLFYAVTTFAVWVWGATHPQAPAHLGEAYLSALPYFGLTLAGNLFYTGALFGALSFADRRLDARSPRVTAAKGP